MRQAMDEVCFEFNVRDTDADASHISNGKTGVFNRLTLIKRL